MPSAASRMPPLAPDPIRNREAPSCRRSLAFLQMAGITPSLERRKAVATMPAKNSKTESDGFSAEERAAMKKRAAELRAESKKGAKKADELQGVLDSIAQMAPQDRALPERVRTTVTGSASQLSPM